MMVMVWRWWHCTFVSHYLGPNYIIEIVLLKSPAEILVCFRSQMKALNNQRRKRPAVLHLKGGWMNVIFAWLLCMLISLQQYLLDMLITVMIMVTVTTIHSDALRIPHGGQPRFSQTPDFNTVSIGHPQPHVHHLHPDSFSQQHLPCPHQHFFPLSSPHRFCLTIMFSLPQFHPLILIAHLRHLGFLHLCLPRCHFIVPHHDLVGGCDCINRHVN